MRPLFFPGTFGVQFVEAEDSPLRNSVEDQLQTGFDRRVKIKIEVCQCDDSLWVVVQVCLHRLFDITGDQFELLLVGNRALALMVLEYILKVLFVFVRCFVLTGF